VTLPGEPTKVCLVTHQWAPSFSGAAHRFRQYLPGLRERGIEVGVICSAAPGDETPESVSRWAQLEFGEIMQDEVEGTSVFRVKLPVGRSLRRNLLLRAGVIGHLRMTGTRIAQFLTLEPFRTYHGSGLNRSGVRGVFTGTQLWTFSRNPVKRILQRQWIRVPLQGMDHVVVSSVVMKDFYGSLGVTTPMSIVPNGVDLQRFRSLDPVADKRAARSALGISTTADLVLFVGSIIRRKGVDLLLDAFAQVAETNPLAELILVGPGDSSGTADGRAFQIRIEELVRRSGAADRIHFKGHVPSADTYIRAADVFVLPSRREGMGNVVLEAMATGVPTVLTPYLGLPAEFGEPGKQYVLSAPDAGSLASHIMSLLMDRNRQRSLGDAGRNWVEKHMSMATAIDAYAKIYHDLAAYGTVRTQKRAMSWIV
jgi:glycosyltransferase involved in cell wall biosynthesis